MGGGYGIFLRGVWDDPTEAQQRDRLLALAKVCGEVDFHDVVGQTIVRVRGGTNPSVELAAERDATAIHAAVKALGTDLSGWIDVHVSFENLDPFRDHGDILVPGLALGEPGTTKTFDEGRCLGSIEDMEAGINETLAEAEESPDEYADQEEFLAALRTYLEVLAICRQHRLILHT
jgi:hypothetical protein